MRCRVLCNGKKETNGIKAEWYKLKSSKRLKQVKKLIPFENDFIVLVQNIRFRVMRNHFQKKIKKKTVTFADKTTKLSRLIKTKCDHLINNTITSKYKKNQQQHKKANQC